jgi:hypothetical protein
LLALAAVFLLSGCGKVFSTGLKVDRTREVRVEPIRSPDRNLRALELFYAEYLFETSTTSTRIGVLAEPLKTPVGIALNPARYVSGLTGSDKTSDLIKRFSPMKFYSLRTSAGKHLGYAFLPPRETLRTISVNKGRYWLEIVKIK